MAKIMNTSVNHDKISYPKGSEVPKEHAELFEKNGWTVEGKPSEASKSEHAPSPQMAPELNQVQAPVSGQEIKQQSGDASKDKLSAAHAAKEAPAKDVGKK